MSQSTLLDQKKNYIFQYYSLPQLADDVTAGPDGLEHRHAYVVPNSFDSRQPRRAGEVPHGLSAGFVLLQTPRNIKLRI